MSDGKTVLITCDWDSGPFGVWYESQNKHPHVKSSHWDKNVVPVPKEVWERYRRADVELRTAEKALMDAEEAFLKQTRPVVSP